MRTVLSYCRLIVFVFGVLAGVQVPHFVDQYGKALQSHYLESDRSLAEFQQEADKFFDGDLQRLIDYYKQSDDQVFEQGGQSIDAIYQRNQQLEQALEAFQSSRWNAFRQAFLQPLTDIRNEVTSNFNYAIQLTPTAISSGLLIGVLLAVMTELLLRLLAWPLTRRRAPTKTNSAPTNHQQP